MSLSFRCRWKNVFMTIVCWMFVPIRCKWVPPEEGESSRARAIRADLWWQQIGRTNLGRPVIWSEIVRIGKLTRLAHTCGFVPWLNNESYEWVKLEGMFEISHFLHVNKTWIWRITQKNRWEICLVAVVLLLTNNKLTNKADDWLLASHNTATKHRSSYWVRLLVQLGRRANQLFSMSKSMRCKRPSWYKYVLYPYVRRLYTRIWIYWERIFRL